MEAVLRIQCFVDLWIWDPEPVYGIGKKYGSEIRNKHLGSFFR
jgi:hypothetical protein